MAPRRCLLLLLSVVISGCFWEASDVAVGTGDTGDTSDGASAAGSAGPSSPASTSGTVGPGSGTTASPPEGGDTGTLGDEGVTSSSDDEGADVSDTHTVVESTGDGDGPLGRYGSSCGFADECEGGFCIFQDPFLPGSCSVACDPTAGGCPAVGHAAFCNRLDTLEFGCVGELNTGDDLEDGLLRAGDTRSGSLDGRDRDAFYLENPLPEGYTFRAYPGAGLNIMISLYDQAEFRGSVDAAGIQGVEEAGYHMGGDPATYPRYPVAVVSAVGGTSGRYEVRLDQP